MCDADVDQIHNLDHILLCFEAILRLKVNLQKSELVTMREVPYIELANILGCNISSLSLCYLGLPLGAPFKSKAIWDKVVEKMKKKGRRVGTRFTCLRENALLSSRVRFQVIPTYFLSLFPLLVGIAKRLEYFQRDFL
jgi:hypothetical protein